MPAETRTTRYRILTVLLATALATVIALSVGPLARAVEGPVDYVYVATGENFPDALAGSTLAAAQNAPLLLVAKNSIPQATKDALTDLDPDKIVILGGPATVSDSVKNQLVAYASSGIVERISGANRYATAADIAAELPEVQPGKVYYLNINGLNATVRTSRTSEPLQDTTVFRPDGRPSGYYCIDIPDDLFEHDGTMAVIQSAGGSGFIADNISVRTTIVGVCQLAGAEIEVRLSTDAGAAANEYVTLLIPGA